MPRIAAIAAAAFALSTGLAVAEALDRLELKLNGHASLIGAVVDQSNMSGLDNTVSALETGLFGAAILPLDGGGEIGGRIALDVDYASNFNTLLDDAGTSDILQELWGYWEGDFGRVQFGMMSGAADILGAEMPSVTKSIRVDNPEIFLMGYPCAFFCASSDAQAPGSIFSPQGMQLRSDLHGSNSYLKVMYVTPTFSGVRLAVSYAPDGTRYPGELFGADELNEQGNVWDFAASYLGTVGDIDVGLSAGIVSGDNVNNTSPGFYGDLFEWGLAAKLGYREWTVGGAFRRTNVAGGGPVVPGSFIANVFEDNYTNIWSTGLTYERGPWMFGVNYIYADEELPFFTAGQQGEGLQFAAGYLFSQNIRFTGGYQHYEFDGPFDICPTDTGGFGCDTLNGNIGYVETTFSF